MHSVLEVPLLAGLPKVELAKLLADVEQWVVPAGAVLMEPGSLKNWAYFIVRGEAQITCSEGTRIVPLSFLGPGELIDDSSLLQPPVENQEIRSVTEVTLCRIPHVRLQRALQSDPKLVREFMKEKSKRSTHALQDLARAKLMLAAYTDAVWRDVSPATDEAAASMPASAAPAAGRPGPASTTPAKGPKAAPGTWRNLIGSGAAVAAAVLAYRFNAGTPVLAAATAILVWATINWLLNTIPDYAVGLAAAVLLVLTGAVKASTAFGGFASPSWFLLLGAGGLGVAVSRSGLLYRVALHMLRRLPPTYRGQSFALALTGLLFTPLMPSANSRVAMASPLAMELSEAMRFPERGRGSAGLSMATFLGFGLMYFVFLNGSNTSLLAWSLLPAGVQERVTWGSWLFMAIPMGLIMFAGLYAAILFLYPPEPTTGVSRATIAAQLQVLGPMSRTERITTGVLGAVLLGFVTQQWHGIDPAWLAVGGFLVLIGLGVLDKNGLKMIDWNFLLLFGTLISLSDVTKVTGLSAQLAQWIRPMLEPVGGSPYLFLTAIGVLTLAVRVIIPLQPTVLMMVVSLLPVATQLGYNPFTVALIVLALSNNWFVPQQNSVYLGVYSATEERSFTHQQTRPLALAHAAVGLLALLASVPFWQALGIVPK
ncbi:MAG TPA: SLC13 family permease [Symbiobacteriaceae bacterium]|nr:SLC13 family permease [Symbiobacteriaceae bacterium]